MAFYIVLWVILMIVGVQYYINGKIPSKYLYILLILGLSFIVAARSNTVGVDTGNYYDFFYSGIAPDKKSREYEPAFMLIRHLCYYIGFNHFVFFFILAFSSLYIIYMVSQKLKIKNYFLPLFIYFSIVYLSYQFNTVRNGVMASVVWLAFVYKLEGHKRKALITMLLAAGFHVVALAFIPILYIVDKQYHKKVVSLMIIIGLTFIIFQLSSLVIRAFPVLASIDRLSGYIETTDKEAYGITVGTIVNVTLFMFMYLKYNDSYISSKGYRVILNTMLLALVVVCVFNTFHAIVSRIGQVLNLSLLFVWPYLIDKQKKKVLKIFIYIGLCGYLWLYYSKGLQSTELWTGRLAYIPYEWYFNGIFR